MITPFISIPSEQLFFNDMENRDKAFFILAAVAYLIALLIEYRRFCFSEILILVGVGEPLTVAPLSTIFVFFCQSKA